jgi:pimeloyl-ACP methyl ester carboxylesterase
MGYLLVIAGVILLAALAGWLYELAAESVDRKRYPPPGKLIDAGGFQLHMCSLGERRPGQPVVILESGHGWWSLTWNPVLRQIAQLTRVCAYDRAGYGWSERSNRQHTPQQVAAELHTLLKNAGESGPYVLVGHSLGGLFIRQYFNQYPDEVVGMVFIDILPEKLSEYLPSYQKMQQSSLRSFRMLAILAHFGLARLLGQRRLQNQAVYILPQERAVFAAQSVSSTYMDSLYEETAEVDRFVRQKPTFAGLGDRPLVVIKAHYPETMPPGTHGYTAESWKQFVEGWSALQREFVGLSSRSQYIEAKAGHAVVIAEEPEVVVNAIRWVVESARQR